MVTNKRWALCLGAGESQKPFIIAAKEMGWRVIAVDRSLDAVGIEMADVHWQLSTWDSVPILNELMIFTEQGYRLDALIARVTGPAMDTAAVLNAFLNLPGPNKELVNICNQKSLLRVFCSSVGIPVPRGRRVAEAKVTEFELPGPWVVRPDITMVGKKAISLCHSMEQLDAAITEAQAHSSNDFADVACYVEGRDIGTLHYFSSGSSIYLSCWEEKSTFTKVDGVFSAQRLEFNCLIAPADQTDSFFKEINGYANQIASLFPGVVHPIALAWRVDTNGRLNLIEMHCDLTGDGILDLLLPAALDQPLIPLFTQALLLAKSGIDSEINTLASTMMRPMTTTILSKTVAGDPVLRTTRDEAGVNASSSVCRHGAVLVIGGGYLQLEHIRCARELGLKVVVTDRDANAPGSAVADEFFQVSGDDGPGLMGIVKEIAQRFDFKGVYCGNDFGLIDFAKIHDELGLPGPQPDAVFRALNKYESKKIWLGNNFPTPKSRIFQELPSSAELASFEYPVIVKPVDSCGSQGVVSADNYADVVEAFAGAKKFSRDILVEDYFLGHGIDTIGIIWNGNFIACGIGERHFSEPPHHFPLYGFCPPFLTDEEISYAYQLTRDACLALGLDNTPVKGDLLYRDGQFTILEVAPRFHGDVFSAKTVPLSFNFNPIKLWFSLLSGHPLDEVLPVKMSSHVGWVLCKSLFPKINGLDPLKIRQTLEDYAETRGDVSILEFYFDPRKVHDLSGRDQHKDNSTLIGFFWMYFGSRNSLNLFYNDFRAIFKDRLL